MIIVHGVLHSRASRTVWALEELGLEWKLDPVIQAPRLIRAGKNPLAAGAPKNTRSPEFLKVSPVGAVPVIEDGDFVLAESLAINLYLAEKAGGPLAPVSLHERALMMQWALYGATWIEDAALVIDKNPEGGKDVWEAKETLARPLDVLETHLSTHSHLVGERFTIAEVGMVEILRYAATAKDLFDSRPHLSAWLAAARERPAYKKMMAMREAEQL